MERDITILANKIVELLPIFNSLDAHLNAMVNMLEPILPMGIRHVHTIGGVIKILKKKNELGKSFLNFEFIPDKSEPKIRAWSYLPESSSWDKFPLLVKKEEEKPTDA